MTDNPSDHSDPETEPTNEQLEEITVQAFRYVRFRAAMADLGIKILAIGLSLEEEHAIMTAWERDRGLLP